MSAYAVRSDECEVEEACWISDPVIANKENVTNVIK